MQTCPHCSKSFAPKAFNQIYCSQACGRSAQKKRASIRQLAAAASERFKETGLKPGEAFCVECGERFQKKSNSSKYCSKECRIIGSKKSADARYERQKADRELNGPRLKRIDCIQCGLSFYSERTKRFCSIGCREERRKSLYCLNSYGIESSTYDKMLKEQSAKCLICDEIKRLVIDHCHTSGKVRGLLCSNCNSGLGLLGDNITNLKRAVLYLQNNG